MAANTEEHGDARLSALLREWKVGEPKANFDAAVWRRIRVASTPESQAVPATANWRDWLFPRVAWVTAMAVALGVVVGVWAGFHAPGVRNEHEGAGPLLQHRTLAGSYLVMVTGDTR